MSSDTVFIVPLVERQRLFVVSRTAAYPCQLQALASTLENDDDDDPAELP